MKVLYIAKRSKHNIAAKTHLKAIKEIYGQENIFEIDLLSAKKCRKDGFISYGYNSKDIGERIKRIIEKNGPFISNKINDDICNIIKNENIDLVFSEESDLGYLYKKIKEKFPKVKIVCFFNDISADLFRQRIRDAAKWKYYYIQACKNVIAQEKITQKYVDEKWVFNKADAKRFVAYYGYKPDRIIPMGGPTPECDNNYKKTVTNSDSKKILLFVCSRYHVNINGFMWFYKNVLPHLNKKYQIKIVGTGAMQLAKKLHDKTDMEITGKVDSVTPYYEKADIVIEPVFDGGGMKVKTIEALSFGKCIISTEESLNGYWEEVPEEVRDVLIYRCNTANEWIAACNDMLNKTIKRYNEEVFDVFEKHFSYDALLEQFKTYLPNI